MGSGTAQNPLYEIWDPACPSETTLFALNAAYMVKAKQNYYPFNYVLPTGDLFNYVLPLQLRATHG